MLALLVASVALASVDRAGADPPVTQLYPIDLRVVGGEASWHSTPVFRLEWERPPIAGRDLPVAAVAYRVRDAAGSLVQEETRLDGTSTMAEVSIPPLPGAYTAEVWMEEAGGERGPAVRATLRYDHGRPGTARALGPVGWIAGSTPAAVSILPPTGPAPVSGIGGYAVSIDHGGETWPCAARDRCEESELDLRGGTAGGTVGLGMLPEGRSVIRVVSVSGAGIPSSEAAVAFVRVDDTRPEVALGGLPGGWADGPVQLAATAVDALSGIAAGGPNGPFTAIAVDGGTPRTALGGSVAVTVSGEGVHRVDAYARDAAGNVGSGAPATAAVAIDESPPHVAFADRQPAAEPERIEATAADSLSGVDAGRGSIAVREAGTSRPWQRLPTTRAGGRLVAHWDSDSYPEGIYEFEARAYDAAGNTASSDRRSNHTKMVLVNPLKRPVRLQAGFSGGGQSSAKTVPYRSRIAYEGRLTSAAGAPLGGLPVHVVESFEAGAVRQRSTRVVTAADGSFALRLRPGPSRTVSASFSGTGTLGSAAAGQTRLGVRGSVRLRVSARTARVGGAPVLFSGRVGDLGARLPGDGLPVELQFKVPGGDWAEFRTVQSDARGRFRYRYRFSDDDSRGVRFRFRAYIDGGDWPYEPAASNGVAVAGR